MSIRKFFKAPRREKILKCPVCGTCRIIFRKMNKNHRPGHVKPLFCWTCMDKTPHVEQN